MITREISVANIVFGSVSGVVEWRVSFAYGGSPVFVPGVPVYGLRGREAENVITPGLSATDIRPRPITIIKAYASPVSDLRGYQNVFSDIDCFIV